MLFLIKKFKYIKYMKVKKIKILILIKKKRVAHTAATPTDLAVLHYYRSGTTNFLLCN